MILQVNIPNSTKPVEGQIGGRAFGGPVEQATQGLLRTGLSVILAFRSGRARGKRGKLIQEAARPTQLREAERSGVKLTKPIQDVPEGRLQEIAQEAALLFQEGQEVPLPEGARRAQEAASRGDLKGVFKAFLEEPVEVGTFFAAQSAAEDPLAAVVRFIPLLGTYIGSYKATQRQELAGGITDEIIARGGDPKDPEALLEVLRDEEKLGEIIRGVSGEASALAGTETAIELLTLGLSRGLSNRFVRAGVEFGSELVGEGASEGARQIAEGGELNAADMLLETLSGTGPSAVTVAGTEAFSAFDPTDPRTRSEAAPPVEPSPPEKGGLGDQLEELLLEFKKRKEEEQFGLSQEEMDEMRESLSGPDLPAPGEPGFEERTDVAPDIFPGFPLWWKEKILSLNPNLRKGTLTPERIDAAERQQAILRRSVMGDLSAEDVIQIAVLEAIIRGKSLGDKLARTMREPAWTEWITQVASNMRNRFMVSRFVGDVAVAMVSGSPVALRVAKIRVEDMIHTNNEERQSSEQRAAQLEKNVGLEAASSARKNAEVFLSRITNLTRLLSQLNERLKTVEDAEGLSTRERIDLQVKALSDLREAEQELQNTPYDDSVMRQVHGIDPIGGQDQDFVGGPIPEEDLGLDEEETALLDSLQEEGLFTSLDTNAYTVDEFGEIDPAGEDFVMEAVETEHRDFGAAVVRAFKNPTENNTLDALVALDDVLAGNLSRIENFQTLARILEESQPRVLAERGEGLAEQHRAAIQIYRSFIDLLNRRTDLLLEIRAHLQPSRRPEGPGRSVSPEGVLGSRRDLDDEGTDLTGSRQTVTGLTHLTALGNIESILSTGFTFEDLYSGFGKLEPGEPIGISFFTDPEAAEDFRSEDLGEITANFTGTILDLRNIFLTPEEVDQAIGSPQGLLGPVSAASMPIGVFAHARLGLDPDEFLDSEQITEALLAHGIDAVQEAQELRVLRPELIEITDPAPPEESLREKITKPREQQQQRRVREIQKLREVRELEDLTQVGATHSELERIREMLDLEQWSPQEVRKMTEALDGAYLLYHTDNPAVTKEDINDVIRETFLRNTDPALVRKQGRRAVNDLEYAGMFIQYAKLLDQLDAVVDEQGRLVQMGQQEAASALNGKVSVLNQEIDWVTEAMRGGTAEAGRVLNMAKMVVNRQTYDLAGVLRRAAATKGTKLTDVERQMFVRLVQERKEIVEKVQQEVLSLEALRAEEVARLAEAALKSGEIPSIADTKAERAEILQRLKDLGFEVC